MAMEHHTSITSLDPKVMRWRPQKAYEKRTKEDELLTPEEITRLIDELTLNSIALATQKEELAKLRAGFRELQVQYNDIYENAPIGYATVDRSGLIFQANLAISGMLKVEKSALIGVNLTGYIESASLETFYSILEKVFETKTPQTRDISLQRTDGTTLACQMQGIYFKNSASCEPIPLCRIAVLNLPQVI